MMASIPAYNEYAQRVLMPAMDQKALAEIKALEANVDHILRMPPDQWPDPVNRGFAKINPDVYVLMQGPSEMGASGRLEK